MGISILVRMESCMRKLREMLNRFMVGRYGVDKLNQFLIYVALITSVITLIVRNGTLNSFLGAVSTVSLLTAMLRMISRNYNARYQENIQFVKATKPINAQIEILKLRWRDKDTHKYVKCDVCKTYTRVPKNVGKIRIKCRKCGNEFIKRT